MDRLVDEAEVARRNDGLDALQTFVPRRVRLHPAADLVRHADSVSLCLSKGLTGGAVPLAVTMSSEAIYEAHLSHDRGRMFFHSSSYTANPVACAAANANLAIWRDEPVLERIELLATRQRQRLSALADIPMLSNLRQLGTMTAFEIGGAGSGYLSDLAPRLLAHFSSHDLLLRPLGNTVYVMPPYCIDDADLDRLYAGIRAFFD